MDQWDRLLQESTREFPFCEEVKETQSRHMYLEDLRNYYPGLYKLQHEFILNDSFRGYKINLTPIDSKRTPSQLQNKYSEFKYDQMELGLLEVIKPNYPYKFQFKTSRENFDAANKKISDFLLDIGNITFSDIWPIYEDPTGRSRKDIHFVYGHSLYVVLSKLEN